MPKFVILSVKRCQIPSGLTLFSVSKHAKWVARQLLFYKWKAIQPKPTQNALMKLRILLKKVQAGFTLIELMVVVAIVGILAAVSIPVYQEYMVKAKIAAAISSVDSIRTAISTCIQDQQGVKDSCTTNAIGIPVFSATKEVASAQVTGGNLVLTLASSGISSDVDGKTITMTPTANSASITWVNSTTITENRTAVDFITKNNGS